MKSLCFIELEQTPFSVKNTKLGAPFWSIFFHFSYKVDLRGLKKVTTPFGQSYVSVDQHDSPKHGMIGKLNNPHENWYKGKII